jgi:hypothetical protein
VSFAVPHSGASRQAVRVRAVTSAKPIMEAVAKASLSREATLEHVNRLRDELS